MKLSFTKMQGCANDYIYLDCRASGVPADIAALAQRLSARHFSVGADGIICICAPVTPGTDGRMRIFNADGSEAQMCGNGVRCVAEWLYTHGVEKPVLTIDTNSGVKRITRQGAQRVQVVDATHLKMRVWERGSGETWACGTGTCATVAALTELGICPAGQDIHVQLRGGELVIRVLPGRQLLMTGSAVTVYEGVAEV